MKTKVLHVIGGMGRGGAPSFVINNLLRMDSSNIQFDFLVRNNNCVFTDIIEEKGGRLFEVPSFPKHLISNFRETLKVFKEYGKEYDAIHVHANALYYILPLLLAKKFGIKKIILHSHNTQSNVGFMQPLHYFNKLFVTKLANIFLACGEEAGYWMYGKLPFEVINNAVDARKFAYNEDARRDIRNEFGITDDSFLIGNVGRFEEVKNHSFLIDIFSKFLMHKPNSVLLLPGDGSLLPTMKEKVKLLGIEDKVIFPGVRSDIEKIYSALDVFVMPSLYEGLPFVAIEAQCSGLKCILSTNVTKESFLTDLCSTMSLEAPLEAWIDKLLYAEASKVERETYFVQIMNNNYDINYTADRLIQIYTK